MVSSSTTRFDAKPLVKQRWPCFKQPLAAELVQHVVDLVMA